MGLSADDKQRIDAYLAADPQYSDIRKEAASQAFNTWAESQGIAVPHSEITSENTLSALEIAGAITGSITGGFTGSTVGAVIGGVLGPAGSAFGAAIGGKVGAIIGTAKGVADPTGTLASAAKQAMGSVQEFKKPNAS
jgi:phage tail tape-measure protein